LYIALNILLESKDPNNPIGKEIKKLRQKLNFTQYLVAEKLGISIPAFSKIETGITDINRSRLKQLLHFLMYQSAILLMALKKQLQVII